MLVTGLHWVPQWCFQKVNRPETPWEREKSNPRCKSQHRGVQANDPAGEVLTPRFDFRLDPPLRFGLMKKAQETKNRVLGPSLSEGRRFSTWSPLKATALKTSHTHVPISISRTHTRLVRLVWPSLFLPGCYLPLLLEGIRERRVANLSRSYSEIVFFGAPLH